MKKKIISAVVSLVGVDTLIGWAIKWFNDSVLSKVKDKDEAAAYCEDVEGFSLFLNGVMNRHQKWMSEEKRQALAATINAVNELAAALKDCNIEKAEVDAIVDKVIAAVKAWKEAK